MTGHPRTGSHRDLSLAGRGDDAVHAEVFDHLSVMVIAVADEQRSHPQARGVTSAKWTGDWADDIFVVYGEHSSEIPLWARELT